MSADAAALGLALVVPLAWLVDQRLGEPRNVFYPVAWLAMLLASLSWIVGAGSA